MPTRALAALFALAVPLAVLGACARKSPEPTGETHAEAKKEEFGKLTLDEVEARIADARAGKMKLAIFDNNAQERFAQSHVPTARWLDAHAVKATDLPADKDTTLVFYCWNER